MSKDMYSRQFNNAPLIWTPSEHHGKNLKKFKNIIEQKYHLQLSGYEDLQKWSTENICEFWTEFWDFLGIISCRRFDKVVDLSIPMNEFPKWFEGAKFNYAENLLKYRDDRLALIVDGEDTEVKTYTFAQMYEEARLYAAAFRKIGLKKGDIVVCHMSNRKEAIFATQAVLSIGAIWTAALPMLGAKAVLERFQQLSPKILLSEDGYRLDGKDINMVPKLAEIVAGLPSLEKVLIVTSKPNSPSTDISGLKNSCFLEEFLKMGRGRDGFLPPMIFEQVPVSHPITITYTSGSTGLPKGIIHGSSILLCTANIMLMNFDTDRDSRWVNIMPAGTPLWLGHLPAHFLGETLVLYEGSPYFLSPMSFWNFLEKHKISHMVMFPDVVDELEKRNYFPKDHDLSSLKLLVTGGCSTKFKIYDFLKKILKTTAFSEVYALTELLQCNILKEMTLPTYKGEINTAALGISMKIFDDEGNSVVGEIGDIVLTKPVPNLPLGLWNDKDNSMYRKKYFSKYPGIFTAGDFGMINPVTKNWIICCRSDEVLNPKGCRFGPSEIYNVVEILPEVLDCLCVPQYGKDMDERAILFLKLRGGYSFNENLASSVRKIIERNCSFQHVPEVILEVKDIPYNLNGKKTEVIVKQIINNFPHSIKTVRNPESLHYFYNIPELIGF